MATVDRRTVIKAGALAGPFIGFTALPAEAHRPPRRADLRPTPDLRDGVVRLDLPTGFQYRSFHDSAVPQVLGDGSNLPGRHDGMAGFGGRRGPTTLVRNHEVNGPTSAPYSTHAPVYDPHAGGGTSTAVVTDEGVVVDSWASLAGTMMNCSGGRMPWRSWLTCEETINGPDVFDDFTRGSAPPTTYVKNKELTKPHGYVFEVPAREGLDASTDPITQAGRFAHESVAFDPHTGALFMSEDDFAFPSGFYKYVPPNDCRKDGRMEDGGRLSMMAVRGRPNLDLSQRQARGTTYKVTWVPIADPDPTFARTADGTPTTTNDDAIHAVAQQGWAQGAAYFSRLEGTVYDSGVVYFTSTQGGGDPQPGPENGPAPDGYGNGFGQVWAYHTRSQKLSLVYQSPGPGTLDYPDNVTTSPRGTLVLCEDHTDDNFLRGLSTNGKLFDIARNAIAGRTDDEFAGCTFGASGRTLFVNIQASRGMSFAIWGDWHRIGV